MRPQLLAALAALVATQAHASEPEWCRAPEPDRYQLLRRLSLDLRLRVPDLHEYEALHTAEDVPEQLVDEWLDGPELRALVREHHRELLWPVLGGAFFFSAIGILEHAGGIAGAPLYSAFPERTMAYRGSGAACADRPQTAFEADGTPIPGPDGLEGWVEVEPYWAPGTRVRVCAFDAQENLVAQDVVNGVLQDVDCRFRSSFVTRRCGCGPGLSFCNYAANYRTTRAAFVEQLLRHIDEVVLSDRPYTDVLLSRSVPVNGPISHFMRWQWGFAVETFVAPDADWSVPEIPFDQTDTWRSVERGPAHAGVLTMPAFLLRFATNRGRAHRFLSSFLCRPFRPPPGGLQLDGDDEPNVAKRQGCAYCHQTLEPAAAYWGRFAETGFSHLDPARYPASNEACRRRAWAGDPLLREACRSQYISEREPLGVLRSHEFALDGTPEGAQLARHADEGPRGIVERSLADGTFATCTVERWWKHFMRRAPTEEERRTQVATIAEGFRAQDYRLKWLLGALVKLPGYRDPVAPEP